MDDKIRFYALWTIVVIMFALTLWRVIEQENACREWSNIRDSKGQLAIQIINTSRPRIISTGYDYLKIIAKNNSAPTPTLAQMIPS